MRRFLTGLASPGAEPAKPYIKHQSRRSSIGSLKGAATIGPPTIRFAPASGAAATNQLFGASVAAGAFFILCM